jgi:ribosomal protein S18 acetylase RimI-like enzyme
MINIRAAQPDDIVAVDAFDPFAHDLNQEVAEDRMLVAEVDGRIVGYVSWKPKGFVGRDFISYLAVDPASHRSGYGKALLRAAAERIRRERVFISTEVDNLRMLGLLEQDGWIAAGAVAGANRDGTAEAFFFKDIPA